MAIVDVIIHSGCITLMCSLIFPGWRSHQGTVFCEVTYFLVPISDSYSSYIQP